MVTGGWITQADRSRWQQKAAAELAVILAAHPGLPVIAWTVTASGGALCGQVRLAGVVPALAVAPAQVPDAGGPFAAGHRARRPAEYRVSRVEGKDPGPELRAHRSHQLFQQARRMLALPGSRGNRAAGAGHRLSCSLVKTVAVTPTATPPRTPRACR